MPNITFIEADGREFSVDANNGDTLMQAAVDNMIDGILAECGGACSCATCHCYIDDAWFERVGAPQQIEQEMIDALDSKPTSRLSCQVMVTDELDGLVVRLPESQY